MTIQPLVDMHCHLDLMPDFPAAIEEVERAGVYTLTVTTTPRAWPRNRDLTADKRYVRAALGLHPQLVREHANEIELWEQYLPEARYVGEIGLDAGPQHFRSLDQQKEIFTHILNACARERDKVLTVHSVRSAKAVLDHIEMHVPDGAATVILHWFSGSTSEARRAVEMGCYFSLNAQMMRSDRGRALIQKLPLDRILTESDGPFAEDDGVPLSPLNIHRTVAILASLVSRTPEELRTLLFQNLKQILGG